MKWTVELNYIRRLLNNLNCNEEDDEIKLESKDENDKIKSENQDYKQLHANLYLLGTLKKFPTLKKMMFDENLKIEELSAYEKYIVKIFKSYNIFISPVLVENKFTRDDSGEYVENFRFIY